jgi:hypothetical protein
MGRAIRARSARALPCRARNGRRGEFVEIFRKLRPRAPIALEATDTGHTFTLSDGEAAVTVYAPSGDLLLLLYGRLSPDDVQVVGDRVLLGVLLTPIE